MSWDYSGNETAEEIEARVSGKIAKLRARGESFELIVPKSKKGDVAESFWGRAWCDNLENYAVDFVRLPLGKRYLRKEKVYNLEIEKGFIFAKVAGADLYDVEIGISELERDEWQRFKDEFDELKSQNVISAIDLLLGKLDENLLKLIIDKERGLFPKRGEIKFSCSCPDYEDMCKHVSAVLYGLSLKLDGDASLFFKLRGVDFGEIVNEKDEEIEIGDKSDEELGEVFGIDL